MLLTFYLLFIGLHVSEGCNLVNREQLLTITAHTGGLTLKEGPPTTTTPTAASNHYSIYFFICIPVLLLLGLGGVIYWRYRGQSRGQTESQELDRTKTEHKTQDEVTYSTVVHSNTTTTTTTVTHIGEKTEYATIRVN
ncbi:hypothetical protein MHYP_G00050440 [Metynnis hypsauchen]